MTNEIKSMADVLGSKEYKASEIGEFDLKTIKTPEVSEEQQVNFSKKCLKRLFLLMEKLKNDLDSDCEPLKAAAVMMIHILTNTLINDEIMKEGDSND